MEAMNQVQNLGIILETKKKVLRISLSSMAYPPDSSESHAFEQGLHYRQRIVVFVHEDWLKSVAFPAIRHGVLGFTPGHVSSSWIAQ